MTTRYSTPISGFPQPKPTPDIATTNVEHPVQVSVDLDEGRYVQLVCLECRTDVRSTLNIAAPFSFFFVSLDCDECGGQLCEFDMFMGVRRAWRSN